MQRFTAVWRNWGTLSSPASMRIPIRIERIFMMSNSPPAGPTFTCATTSKRYISSHTPACSTQCRLLVAAGRQCLLESLCITFSQPAFFDEAIHGFRNAAHVILTAAVQFADFRCIEGVFVAHLATRTRPRAGGEIRGIRHVDEWCPHAAQTMAHLVRHDACLRRNRVLQLDPGSTRRRNSLPDPLIKRCK